MPSELTANRQCIADTPNVPFAVLVGSRVDGMLLDQSDWDIAVQWQYGTTLDRISNQESLRQRIVQMLSVPDEDIVLIDLSSSRLAMQALVVEEGHQIMDWRELENYYRDKTNAA